VKTSGNKTKLNRTLEDFPQGLWRIGPLNWPKMGDPGRARTPLRAGAAPANRRRARSGAPHPTIAGSWGGCQSAPQPRKRCSGTPSGCDLLFAFTGGLRCASTPGYFLSTLRVEEQPANAAAEAGPPRVKNPYKVQGLRTLSNGPAVAKAGASSRTPNVTAKSARSNRLRPFGLEIHGEKREQDYD
jgi:hypothetical protein